MARLGAWVRRAGGGLRQASHMGSQRNSRSCRCSRGPAAGVGWRPPHGSHGHRAAPAAAWERASEVTCWGQDSTGPRGCAGCSRRLTLGAPCRGGHPPGGHGTTGRGHGAAPGERCDPCHVDRGGQDAIRGADCSWDAEQGQKWCSQTSTQKFTSPKQLPA